MAHIQTQARNAGALYLLAGGLGAFAELYVRQQIYVPTSAQQTASNILNAEFLYQLGMLAELGMAVLYLFVALALYRLLKDVNKALAEAMVLLVAICVPIVCVGVVNQYASLDILYKKEILTPFDQDHLQTLSYLFLRLQRISYIASGIFFGLWLLPLGLLVFQSKFLPKIFGILLVAACGAYLVEVILALFRLSQFYFLYDFTTPVYAVAELGFIAWLLSFGVNVKKWDAQNTLAFRDRDIVI